MATALTFFVILVRLYPVPITSPLWTMTQPTGTSPFACASSAYVRARCDDKRVDHYTEQSYHVQRSLHKSCVHVWIFLAVPGGRIHACGGQTFVVRWGHLIL